MKAAVALVLLAGCASGYSLDGDTVAVVAFQGQPASSRRLYLKWATGRAPSWPAEVDACHGLTPPASTTPPEVRAAVLAQLNEWYADFDATWVEGEPASGPRYEVVVSDGPATWCGMPANTGGLAPFACRLLPSAVSQVFSPANQDAHDIATAVAQEQAHQFGLAHVDEGLDVMDPTLSAEAVGFVDLPLPVAGEMCGRKTQNSHADMTAVLGAGVSR